MTAMQVFKAASEEWGFIEAKKQALELINEFFADWTGGAYEYDADHDRVKRFTFRIGSNGTGGVVFELNEDKELNMGWLDDPQEDLVVYLKDYGKNRVITRDNIGESVGRCLANTDIRTPEPEGGV